MERVREILSSRKVSNSSERHKRTTVASLTPLRWASSARVMRMTSSKLDRMKLTTLRSEGGSDGYAARIRARESTEFVEVSDMGAAIGAVQVKSGVKDQAAKQLNK